jgi:hypothetical protein
LLYSPPLLLAIIGATSTRYSSNVTASVMIGSEICNKPALVSS